MRAEHFTSKGSIAALGVKIIENLYGIYTKEKVE